PSPRARSARSRWRGRSRATPPSPAHLSWRLLSSLPADAIILQDAPALATTAARREATTRHDAWHRGAETGTVERGAGPVPGPWHALGRAAADGVPALRPIEKGHHGRGDQDR